MSTNQAPRAAERAGPAWSPPLVLGRWRTPFYYGWIIVGVVFAANFIASGMGGQSTPLFFRPMHESLGWSLTLFTGAVTASTLAGTAVVPFLGRLLDRIGPRPVMLWGAVVAGVGLVLLSRVQEVWQFWILYAAVGALGLHELGSFTGTVVISKWFVRKRGRAIALAGYGSTIAGVVMTPIVGLLLATVGWRATWGIMGVALLVLMVPLVLLFMRRRPEDFGLLPDGDLPSTPGDAIAKGRKARTDERSWTLREAMRTRTLWVLVASMNLISFLSAVQTFHGITFLTQQQGLSVATVGAITTARWLGVSLARIPWAFLLDRIPVRNAMVACFAIKSTSLLWLIVLPYPANIAGYLITFAAGGAQALVQPMAFATYYGRGSQGTIQGAMQPLLAIPSLVGPLLVAFLFDAVGNFNVAFVIASTLGFGAAIVALFATPPVYREQARVATKGGSGESGD